MENNKKSPLDIKKFLIIALIVVLLIVLGDDLKSLQVKDIINNARDNRSVAILIIWGLYALKSVLFVIPISLLYMSTGIIFSPVQSIVINAIGLIVELTITFFLGKYLGEERVKRIVEKQPKMQKLKSKKLNNNSTIFLVRFVPVFPIDFISLILGAMGTKYWGYIVASIIGVLPRMTTFSLMGDAINNPLSKEFLIPLILLGLLGFAGIKVYNCYEHQLK
ncbi:MAG: TVP38/TMEM64 family protein [Cellulosilyticaceae bacterium]